eukprot:14568017-Heterocapsa_arctica.AAC.1
MEVAGRLVWDHEERHGVRDRAVVRERQWLWQARVVVAEALLLDLVQIEGWHIRDDIDEVNQGRPVL